MFCKKCGQELPEGGKFCPNCGADNSPTENTQQAQPTQEPVYTGTVNGAPTDGIQNRSLVLWILITIFTCGIGGLIWVYLLVEDINKASGDTNAPSGIIVILLSLVTCSIYTYIWMWKAGKQLNQAKETRGMSADPNMPLIYLLLAIFGFGIVAYALMQNDLNNLAA